MRCCCNCYGPAPAGGCSADMRQCLSKPSGITCIAADAWAAAEPSQPLKCCSSSRPPGLLARHQASTHNLLACHASTHFAWPASSAPGQHPQPACMPCLHPLPSTGSLCTGAVPGGLAAARKHAQPSCRCASGAAASGSFPAQAAGREEGAQRGGCGGAAGSRGRQPPAVAVLWHTRVPLPRAGAPCWAAAAACGMLWQLPNARCCTCELRCWLSGQLRLCLPASRRFLCPGAVSSSWRSCLSPACPQLQGCLHASLPRRQLTSGLLARFAALQIFHCSVCDRPINDGSERLWTGRHDAPPGEYR